ncbi:hypothetical protein K1Y25_01140 [Mammaliicoccus sciuri]|uniref:hypothetical protein n=1 Tax=Mammaliicoccus sciuri TaxID=1296 RepID=UPI001E4D8410|nr:hypothetical protein [Mammaliicoccus sciuri]MCD8807858.1 hypothetical protein [Mammaliicoccus sciuri]MCD8893282.1 hypothetical protein [Mammaliicoccus sciuri]MCD8911428.1 hypothetical protein [Mammaliicoccus sciuri]
MKNIILIVLILCLTICSAILMISTDSEDTSKTKDKKTSQKSGKKLELKDQKDLEKIIISNKDEQTKMNAYNEAVKKEIIPRSNNYQKAELAFEESLKIKNEK